MEIGLRVLALVLDFAFCLGILQAVSPTGGLILKMSGSFGVFLGPLFFVLFLLWPVLYFAVPTAIWGKTLGKMVCRLGVTDHYGRSPGFWRALGREVLKCLAVFSGLGAALTFFQILYQGSTWYDDLCGTQVKFSPYVRLTGVQKNWRKIHKNKIPPSRRF